MEEKDLCEEFLVELHLQSIWTYYIARKLTFT